MILDTMAQDLRSFNSMKQHTQNKLQLAIWTMNGLYLVGFGLFVMSLVG